MKYVFKPREIINFYLFKFETDNILKCSLNMKYLKMLSTANNKLHTNSGFVWNRIRAPRDVTRVNVLALADERADGIGTKKNWSYYLHRDFVRILWKFLGRNLNSRTHCKTCLISSKQLSNSEQFLAVSAWLECRSCNIASLGAGITYRLLL